MRRRTQVLIVIMAGLYGLILGAFVTHDLARLLEIAGR
jgi:hypothetical protein